MEVEEEDAAGVLVVAVESPVAALAVLADNAEAVLAVPTCPRDLRQ